MTQRTSTEVSRWLQKQEWYESYIDNLERYRDYDSDVVNCFKNGYKYHETICPLSHGFQHLKGTTIGIKLTNNLKTGTMETTRTAEEISQYMRRQPWLYKFMRNCRFKGCICKAQAEGILSGKYGKDTLRSGFIWTRSFEGLGYWRKKHYEFIKWYYGNEIKN